MTTSKNFHVYIMLLLQLLCLSFLAHASPGTVVPHEWSICLADNYTLESHWQFLGKELNISSYHNITNVYHIDFYNITRTHDLSEETIIDLIRSDPNVEAVAPDEVFSLDDRVDEPVNPVPRFRNQSHHINTTSRVYEPTLWQQDAPWPLVQISADQPYPFEYNYYYMQSSGGGVDVYVLDTGMDPDMMDFQQDRYKYGPVYVPEEMTPEDFNGHGTHVAGLVGSDTYGVCKLCNVISVKICNSTGKFSKARVHDAINYVTWKHGTKVGQPGFNGSVINMSFGMRYTLPSEHELMRKAVRAAYEAGIVMVAAGGNDYGPLGDAGYLMYPATSPKVITVAASVGLYQWYRGSNYGSKIDMIAPGSCESYWKDGNTKVVTGTSQAAPLVAGTIALFMGHEGPMNMTTAKQRLMANADIDVVQGVPDGTHNAQVNSGIHKGIPYIGAPFI